MQLEHKSPIDMEILNNKELGVAKAIINAGLKAAAEKLSFFMKEPVQIKEVDVNGLEVAYKEGFQLKYEANTHLLLTEVVGELEGLCCLVFSEQEANHFQQKALPEEITQDSNLFETMKEAILLEVDNIIAASVVTEFSNLLQRKMHGSVPQLKVINNPDFEKFIAERLSSSSHIINFKTSFVSSNKAFSPLFIWFMNEPFIDDIKQYANHQTVGI